MSVDSYIAARTAYVRAHDELRQIAEITSKVANALQYRPGDTTFTNTDIDLPPEAQLPRKAERFDANQWRGAREIMGALAAWHSARHSLFKEWDALTKDQQTALQPPPGSAGGRHR